MTMRIEMEPTKQRADSAIFAPMKRILLSALLILVALPVLAQHQAVGILFGTAEGADGDFNCEFDDSVFEVFYATEIELGAEARIKLGRVETGHDEFLSHFESVGDVEIAYLDLLVQYRFDEVFGSTTIFAGPGAYQVDHDGGDESDFGFSAGVGVRFPVTRRTSVLAEFAYHWANFEKDFDFVNLNIGFRFGF